MDETVRTNETAAAEPEEQPETAQAAASGEVEEAAAQTPKMSFRDLFLHCRDFLAKYSWIVLLALSVGLIAYYIWLPSREFFHSDTTDTLMWAVASNEGGSLFNADFHYACLLPFSTSLIMTALIPVFGVTMTTHVLGMLIFFLLLTGALIWMCRKMKWSWGWTSVMVSIFVMMLSGSEKIREIFWGHTIYYSLGIFFVFAGLALVFHHMDLGARKDSRTEFDPADKTDYKLVLMTVLIGIWFVLTCTNQLNAMTIFAMPVMAAVFCERFLDTSCKPLCKKNRRALLLFAVMGVGMVAGYYLTILLADGVTAGYASAYSSYSPMDEWVTNIQKFPEHWLRLLGADVIAGTAMLSAESIRNLLIIITGVVILVMPLIALCCYNKIKDEKLRVLILTYWFMTALIMLGYICGKLSSANWRLSPIAAMSVVVTVAFFRWAVSQISMQRIISVLMVPVILVAAINAVTIAKMSPTNYENAVLYRLAQTLEDNGLNYGYATFWRANGITVISDSEVECRSVNIDDNGVTPYRYQSADEWYKNQPNQDKYFLLMTDVERNNLMATDSHLLELPHEEIPAHGYIIWVFDQNLFVK